MVGEKKELIDAVEDVCAGSAALEWGKLRWSISFVGTRNVAKHQALRCLPMIARSTPVPSLCTCICTFVHLTLGS